MDVVDPAIPATHPRLDAAAPKWVNDCHSRLNRTRVSDVARPRSIGELRALLSRARMAGRALIPFGGRHAMGGQQFLSDATAVDLRGLNRVLGLDARSGILEVEAGITWPEILAWLDESRPRHGSAAGRHGWAIAQKQTGADDLTLGGALAANVHGRGLVKAPIVEDVASFTLLDPEGRLLECSRHENPDLFAHAIGGYGLFGIICTVRLCLTPRRRLQRVVRMAASDELVERFDRRIADGFLFGDFQFHIDHSSDDFLRRGIFSCYRPAPEDAPEPPEPPILDRHQWLHLIDLAHTDKSRGFRLYREHYERTDGSFHWSDSHQFTVYVDGYHDDLDRRAGHPCPRSEMITELYVPRPALAAFLDRAREELRRQRASVIYGTVRLIERDAESFLSWAREPWACVVLNLCVEHSPTGMDKARTTFRRLIDRALELGGSFYLTYHRFATRAQVEAAHPRFAEFLARQREWDPHGRFQSDWLRHHRTLLGR